MRSVVLACYQGEQFIGEQLDSILAQLAPEDELIVSDDASADRTLEVIAQRADPRLRVCVNSVRVGYVGNFQRALALARGDRIFFSDQDDVWLPNKVAAVDTALRRARFVASDARVVNADLEVIQESYFQGRGARSFSAAALFFRPAIIGATMACQQQYLRTLLPLPAGIPHDFWLSLNAAWDQALTVIPVPLILYRRHTSAASVTATDRRRRLRTIAAERWRMVRTFAQRRMRSAGHRTTV